MVDEGVLETTEKRHREPMGIPREVILKASKQGGHITREQLVELGISASAADRRVRSGDFTVVTPGLYRVFASDDHVDVIRGAVLALPGVVASHQSAAHLLGFPRLPKMEPTVTVPSKTTHRFPGVTVRRTDDLEPSYLTSVDRVPVTNVVRTTFDLAGVLAFHEFEAIAESLILAGRMELRHLCRMTEQLSRRGKRGSAAAKDFIEMRAATNDRASTLERRGRALLAADGLPAPIAEHPIPWSTNRRFDDAYPDSKLAIEWDSLSWHSQQAAMSSDRQRDREAAIHGWVVVRFTWQDVTENPTEVVATVASLLQIRGATRRTQGSQHR